MPLSEHEQRLLDQLEKQLNADDPQFAQNVGSHASTPTSSVTVRNLVLGVLLGLVGLGVVVAGVATKIILLGVLGFLIAAAGAYLATKKTAGAPQRTTTHPRTTNQKKTSGFMQNLEERWDERRNRGL